MKPAARRLVLGAMLLAIAVPAAVGALLWRDYTLPGPLAQSRVVVLPHGAGLGRTARALADAGVIAHRWSFVAGVFVEGKAGALKAGEYDFAAAISPRAAGFI